MKIVHHPRSLSEVTRFRSAAAILIAGHVLAISIGGLMIHSMLTDNLHLMKAGSWFVIPAFILPVFQWIVASGAGCPLCRTPVLAPRSCMKHRRARTVFGSHRLRVALAVLLKNRFRCPYCNESTTLELRKILRDSRPRRSHMD